MSTLRRQPAGGVGASVVSGDWYDTASDSPRALGCSVMTLPAVPTRGKATGFRATQRPLADALAGGSAAEPGRPSLESQRLAPADPPRLARAAPIEGNTVL